MKTSERNEQLAGFADGEIEVCCACDLLNEGWDCPQTEALFMARPMPERYHERLDSMRRSTITA